VSAVDGISVQPDQEPGKISLDLKGMDVVEVIKMLASKGNLNVVLGSDVKGRVTIFLKSVYLMDALEIILVANNLAYDKRGEILYVMSQRDYERMYGEKYAEKKELMIYRFKYAKAVDVVKALNQMKTKVGKIIVDEGSNTVIIMDSPSTVAQINDAIQNIDIPTVTKIFELKYAKAVDMKDRVTESLTKGLGTMQIDERTNKIAVTDLEKKIGDIERVITAFDDKPQQVLIEAKILEVTLDDHLQLGVDWDSVIKKIQKEISLKSAFQLASFSAFGPPGAEILVGVLGSSGVDVMIQVLKTVGDTNLLSSPRITAINNQEAKILVGSSQPYATNTITQSTGTATTGTNISFLDIGVKLFVTPSINKDGFITMKIRPEVSSTSSNYTYGTPATTIPIVQTTQAETSVSVKDGTTIVIGGLIKDLRTKTVNKIPIVGDIPILKYMFSNTNEEIKKQELVIFLTPHIITGENDYLESPKTPPTDEKRFTVPEATTFERRDAVPMKPGLFKEKRPGPADRYVAGSGKPGDMESLNSASTPQEYYIAVKNRIIKCITVPSGAKHANIKGKVRTAFFLTPSGAIARGPDIIESSNHALDASVMAAVKTASPFSAFPDKMSKTEKRFVMDIAFE
jgi:general secretion pathway protein D